MSRVLPLNAALRRKKIAETLTQIEGALSAMGYIIDGEDPELDRRAAMQWTLGKAAQDAITLRELIQEPDQSPFPRGFEDETGLR